MKISGINDDALHMIVNRARLSKLLSVIPKSFVNAAPISVPTVEAPLYILINVAKSTASTPGGHNLAASTKVGKKASSPSSLSSVNKKDVREIHYSFTKFHLFHLQSFLPKIDRTASSPNTNAPSGRPSTLL